MVVSNHRFLPGAFALFTMYLPPLFPTLLRTTGAGFCYNIGRIVAAAGPRCFSGCSPRLATTVRHCLIAGFLFLPAAVICIFLPRVKD